MKKAMPPKSLKDQARWQLWLTIAANFAAFYAVAQSGAIAVEGFAGLINGAANLLPVGVALVVTSIANGLLNAAMKARLVFFRWKDALPGHRAFSYHAKSDPRIDMGRLMKVLGGTLPEQPEQQNHVWYRLYKKIEHDPAILQIHREFLFTRDYTAFAFLFLIGFGTASLFVVHAWQVAAIYLGCLAVQFVVVRQAAANYGVRFVTTVLALTSVKKAKLE